MDAKALREILAALSEAGVARAKIPIMSIDGPCPSIGVLEIEFAPPTSARPAKASLTTMTDPVTGEPVDLSEGAPETAREDVDAQIAARNFERGKS